MGRQRKDCPIPGCSSKDLARLSNHLISVHGIESTKVQIPVENRTVEKITPQSSIAWDPTPKSLEMWWKTQSLLPFLPCSSFSICGATRTGKTRWVYTFLQHINGMFIQNPPKKILYCYGIYQQMFEDMKKAIPGLELHEGLPRQEAVEKFTDGQHNLIILDDLMDQVTQCQEMELMFTQGCHHKSLSVMFITQNQYYQGKCARTIALNTQYIVLFRNLRDASQVMTLARQLYPGRSAILMESYEDCTKEPYGYLVIDVSPYSEDKYRLRTNIFPGEDPKVYIPKV
jgi:hypothetical protein